MGQSKSTQRTRKLEKLDKDIATSGDVRLSGKIPVDEAQYDFPDASSQIIMPPNSEEPFPMSPMDHQSVNLDDENGLKDEPLKRPAVFRWGHGGDQVSLTGSFDEWGTDDIMHRSHNEFTLIRDLKPGTYEYAFVVDGKRKVDPNLPKRKNSDGVINNILTMKSPSQESNNEVADAQPYSQAVPSRAEFSKEPPVLPPQLNFILLNCPQQHGVDPLILPVPQHVTVNHFYIAEKKNDDILVLGITQRYKTKFVTTVYYRPVENLAQEGKKRRSAPTSNNSLTSTGSAISAVSEASVSSDQKDSSGGAEQQPGRRSPESAPVQSSSGVSGIPASGRRSRASAPFPLESVPERPVDANEERRNTAV
eukprot:231879_1